MTLTERIKKIEDSISKQGYGLVLNKKLSRKESNERIKKLCAINSNVTLGFTGNTMKSGSLSRYKGIFMVGERAFKLDEVRFIITKNGKYEVETNMG